MRNIACVLEHSVEAEVSPLFAWNWRTDIKTWDDPPAQFQLDGLFASGSWGSTLFPGREPVRWQIRDVRPGAAFIIEVPLDGAAMSFEWLFDAVSNHRTRITQRILLWGDNAKAYVNQVQAGFGSTLADGMKKIADALERAERSTRQQYRMNSLFRAKDSDFHHRLVAVSRTDSWAITGGALSATANARAERSRPGEPRDGGAVACARDCRWLAHARDGEQPACQLSITQLDRRNHLDVGPLRVSGCRSPGDRNHV